MFSQHTAVYPSEAEAEHRATSWMRLTLHSTTFTSVPHHLLFTRLHSIPVSTVKLFFIFVMMWRFHILKYQWKALTMPGRHWCMIRGHGHQGTRAHCNQRAYRGQGYRGLVQLHYGAQQSVWAWSHKSYEIQISLLWTSLLRPIPWQPHTSLTHVNIYCWCGCSYFLLAAPL